MSSIHVAWSEGAGGPITALEIPLLAHSQGLRGCPLSRPDGTLFGRSSPVGQLSAHIGRGLAGCKALWDCTSAEMRRNLGGLREQADSEPGGGIPSL